MKKILTAALLAVSASGFAQQVQGDFDADWGICTPWDSGNTNKSAGYTPQGWNVSNVYTALGAVTAGEEIANGNGKAVKLTNTSKAGQSIPAYITLGTPWATAETKLTSVRNADGGAFGGKAFTYVPDALSFDYQRDNSSGTENAYVVAYLWKGTYTQKDVPGNTAVGVISWGSATKVDMTDRDRHVLGKETTLGGEKSQTSDAALIASLEKAISEKTSDWTNCIIPFNYQVSDPSTAGVEKINIIFSANDYFGDRSSIVSGNSLTLDNVKLIYYHALTALSYGGKAIANFSENTTSYELNEVYDANKAFTYEKKGVGATVEVSKYNEETRTVTITVKGNDYESDNTSLTTYTVKFAAPKTYTGKLSSLTVNGTEISLTEGTDTYEVTGNYTEGCIKAVAEDGDDATVSISYNEETRTATVKVEAGDKTSTTYVKFNAPAEYTGLLASLTVNGESMTLNNDNPYYVVEGEYSESSINAVAEDGDAATVSVTYDEQTRIATINVMAGEKYSVSYVKFIKQATSYQSKLVIDMEALGGLLDAPAQAVGVSEASGESGTLEMQLRNFTLDFGYGAMNLGDIFVENVAYAKQADGSHALTKEITDGSFKIFGAGSSLEISSLSLNGTLADDGLRAKLNINWAGESIIVDVYPVSTTSIDLTAYTVFDTKTSTLRTGLTNPNALVYVSSTTEVADEYNHNVVIGDQCADLTLTDGYEFNAPTAFTAATTTYTREFSTTAENLASFVLPVSTTAGNINGKVYKLTSAKDDVLSFTSLKEDEQVEANVPYLVSTTSSSLFKDNTNLAVSATPESMEVSATPYRHVGAYAKQAVESADNLVCYELKDNSFAKAESTETSPFGTYLLANETMSDAPAVLVINLDGTKTAIVSATDSAAAASVSVFTVSGQLLRSNVSPANALNGLPAGVYIVGGHKVVK